MGHPTRASSLVEPGSRVSHYEILAELGRGGMGVVYRARDVSLGRLVALKRPWPAGDDEASNFKRLVREARAASRLSHPHIVPIYEVFEHEGVPWLAMELVDGTTLRGLLAAGRPLPLAEVLRHSESLATALETAHAADVLHRDVNPNNIMVTPDGRAVVMDFGLARLMTVSEDSTTYSRHSGQSGGEPVVGTIRYMSPEQALGKPLDARSDLFSLGVVIYEMCAGTPAFPGRGQDVLDALLHRPPVALSRLNYDTPEELERIVRKALAKDPGDRYQSARDMLGDIRALRRSTEHAQYKEPPGLASRSRRSWIAAAAALAGLALAIRSPRRAPVSEAAAVPGPNATLAVIPFENATRDSGWANLADGITDDVTRELQVFGVVVKSREAAAQLKDLAKLPDAEIARRLDVDRVGRGTISLDGEDILLTASVVQARGGGVVWRRTYRHPLDRLGELYAAVASDIAASTRGTAPPAVDAYHPRLDAYKAYHRGRMFWEQRTRKNMERSVEEFERATTIDPGYAQAYAALAGARLGLGVPSFGASDPGRARSQGKADALRAIAIDPNLAEAHAALAYSQYAYDWDWGAAEAEFQKAIQLNPQYATAHHWYADYLNSMGRQEEATREIRVAARLEPLSILIHRDIAWHYFFQRRYDEAIAHLRETLRIDPHFVAAHTLLARALFEVGREAEGLAHVKEVEAELPRPAALSFIAYGEAAAGQKRRAEALLKELAASRGRDYVSPYYVALVHARLGNHGEALEWLERGREEHDATMTTLKVDPRLDVLRGEPRLQALVQEMKFP